MMDKSAIFACIDLGSNMCRMLIARPNRDKPLRFSVIKSCSILVSIGKNSNFIDSKSINRIYKALEKCKMILYQYQNPQVYCIATAIFRSAHNSTEVLKDIYQKFGLYFRICDPGEEIMFSACGCYDLIKYSTVFVMDMGGGSTEIGLFEQKDSRLDMMRWISLPYGLFYFENSNISHNKPLPIDSYRAFEVFTRIKYKFKSKISIIICRSGIMTLIATYIARQNNVNKNSIYGIPFDINKVCQVITEITQLSDQELTSGRFLNGNGRVASSRGTLIFTRELLKRLPVQYVILGNGGVKEGMMNIACTR